MTPIAVMASDNHLAPGAWKGRLDIRGDSYFALRQIVDLCISKRLPLILAGDFFDANRPSAEDLQAALMLNEIINAGLRVFYIQAQHDYDNPSYISVICPKATNLDDLDKPVYISDKSLHMRTVFGRNFMSRTELDSWLNERQVECDLMVMHQLWIEFMGMHGQTSLERLEKCKFLLTGDLHDMRTFTTGKGITVLSPGATQMQSIKEPTRHQVFILNDDMSANLFPLKSRGVIDILVEREEQIVYMVNNARQVVEEMLRAVASGGSVNMQLKPIVRFKIANPIPGAVPKLGEAFEAHAAVFFVGGSKEVTEEVPLMFQERHELPVLEEAAAVMADNFAPDDPSLRDAMELIESKVKPADAVRALRSRYVEVQSAQ